MPTHVLTGSITLFHCLHCPAPLTGVLRDLERFLTGPDQTGPDQTGPDQTGPDQTGPDQNGVVQRLALFEIVDFCIDGRWLQVDVQMQADQQTVPWGVYAQWLEQQTELAENEALRRRFLPSAADVPVSTDRVWIGLPLDADEA
jgi:hypothetical protein